MVYKWWGKTTSIIFVSIVSMLRLVQDIEPYLFDIFVGLGEDDPSGTLKSRTDLLVGFAHQHRLAQAPHPLHCRQHPPQLFFQQHFHQLFPLLMGTHVRLITTEGELVVSRIGEAWRRVPRTVERCILKYSSVSLRMTEIVAAAREKMCCYSVVVVTEKKALHIPISRTFGHLGM